MDAHHPLKCTCDPCLQVVCATCGWRRGKHRAGGNPILLGAPIVSRGVKCTGFARSNVTRKFDNEKYAMADPTWVPPIPGVPAPVGGGLIAPTSGWPARTHYCYKCGAPGFSWDKRCAYCLDIAGVVPVGRGSTPEKDRAADANMNLR